MNAALLLPVDGCPECITERNAALVHPHRVVTLDIGIGIRAWYECPACGHHWWTSWVAEQIDVPCPGCPACVPGVGAA